MGLHDLRLGRHTHWQERLDDLDLVGRLDSLRSQPHLQGFGTALAFLAAVGSLQAVQLVRGPAAGSLAAIASQADLMNALAVLAVAGLVYLDWWVTGNEVMGWFAAGLLVTGVTGTGVAALGATGHPLAVQAGWTVALALVLASQLLATLLLSRRRRCARRPLAAGVGGGVLLTTVTVVLADSGVLPTLAGPVRNTMTVALSLMGAAIAIATWRLTSAPRWFRIQVGVAMALLGCSQAAAHLGAGGPTVDVVVVMAGGAGAAAAWGGSYALVQQAITEGLRSLSQLRHQVRQLEASARDDRARRHEIEATLAGLATAAALMRTSTGMTRERRRVLECMVQSETSRLHRLVSSPAAGPLRAVRIDDVAQPLVERLRVHGHHIDWHRSGLRALCDPDELAAALSVLLENAARHAPGASITVATRSAGARVEIVVSDTGGGVAPEVRHQLFQWGARRPGSPGQGIGLHNAWQLVSRQRGDLRLVDEPGRGATFVIGLRAPEGVDHGPVLDRTVAPASAQ